MKLSRKAFLTLMPLLIWSVAYVGWTAEWLVWKAPHLAQHSLRRLGVCLIGALCCAGISACMDWARPLGRLWRIATGLGLAVLAMAVFSLANYVFFYAIDPLWGPVNIGEMMLVAEVGGWIFLLWTALYLAYLAYEEAYETRLRLSEANQAELRSRYHALTVQTQPHFLFNALNSISALILDKEPARAEKVVLALAGLLRMTLETESRPWIPLQDELSCIRKYIEIETARYDERLVYVEDVPETCLSLLIPPLILLPLIENVVRHGVIHSTEPVTLALSARVEDGRLHLAVADDAAPERAAGPNPGAGLGQANVRQRLAILFGADARLACSPGAGGYRSVVELPVRTAEDA